MERSAVNPVAWSTELGFNQGELVTGAGRILFISGQTAMDADGRPRDEGDAAAQLRRSLDNVEAVLAEARMGLRDLVRLNVYSTGIDDLLPHHGELASRLAAVGAAPTTTMLEVVRLAVPGQVVELEGIAVG